MSNVRFRAFAKPAVNNTVQVLGIVMESNSEHVPEELRVDWINDFANNLKSVEQAQLLAGKFSRTWVRAIPMAEGIRFYPEAIFSEMLAEIDLLSPKELQKQFDAVLYKRGEIFLETYGVNAYNT